MCTDQAQREEVNDPDFSQASASWTEMTGSISKLLWAPPGLQRSTSLADDT